MITRIARHRSAHRAFCQSVNAKLTVPTSWLEWGFYAATEIEAPAALKSAAAYFATQLRHAEQALQDGRPFLVGARLSTADMLLTTCLDWAVSYQVPVTAACRAYLGRITSRPAYRTAVAANTPKTA
jgi:glutathione S-transferase